eukprot:Skav216845  [mRNA]  locus=scaffold2997:88812:101367:+ [translate_table: standard]
MLLEGRGRGADTDDATGLRLPGGKLSGTTGCASQRSRRHRRYRHRPRRARHRVSSRRPGRASRRRSRRSSSWRPRFPSTSPSFAAHAALDPTRRLPCGLTSVEVLDLLSREITPDDYELLLRLDKAISQPVASTETVEALPSVLPEDFKGQNCSICLAPFEDDSEVAAMQCKHQFHRSCISRWLSECRKTCPLCGKDAS